MGNNLLWRLQVELEFDSVILVVQVVRRVLHPTIPPKREWGIVSDMMASCFNFDAELRPTFEDICKRFAV